MGPAMNKCKKMLLPGINPLISHLSTLRKILITYPRLIVKELVFTHCNQYAKILKKSM